MDLSNEWIYPGAWIYPRIYRGSQIGELRIYRRLIERAGASQIGNAEAKDYPGFIVDIERGCKSRVYRRFIVGFGASQGFILEESLHQRVY